MKVYFFKTSIYIYIYIYFEEKMLILNSFLLSDHIAKKNLGEMMTMIILLNRVIFDEINFFLIAKFFQENINDFLTIVIEIMSQMNL